MKFILKSASYGFFIPTKYIELFESVNHFNETFSTYSGGEIFTKEITIVDTSLNEILYFINESSEEIIISKIDKVYYSMFNIFSSNILINEEVIYELLVYDNYIE